jgi:hypothetical protein
MLRILNIFFHALHVGLIVFILIGCFIPPLRTAHLIACGLILLSWFGLGLPLRKPGFCLFTEIQYHIRHRMGIQMERQSYIVYLGEKLTSQKLNPTKAEWTTQGIFYLMCVLSLVLAD